jgi:hypothetical protein
MIRHSWERFRQIAPGRGGVIPFVVLFVTCEGVTRYVESLGIRLEVRPASALLFVWAAVRGYSRVTRFHPVFQQDYGAWLETTPWNNRKPLPLGPVELVLEDGLILAPMLLLSATLPQPRAVSLLCTFLLGNLAALVRSFWLTRVRLIGYISAFGLGVAVKLWDKPIECLAMGALVYLIAYQGLVQALDRFPWTPRRFFHLFAFEVSLASSPRELCGWPHDRMLGEVVAAEGLPRLDAVICCALASWWLYVFFSLNPNERERTRFLFTICQFPLWMFPLARLAVYTLGHRWPISLWGRIRTGRWIIPGYDYVFVAPLCALIAGPVILGLLHALGCPPDACIVIGSAVTAAVALVAPPRLRRWRLTGHHRIVHGLYEPVFIKVG